MQLKLRVGVGDTLTIDVRPSDTFQDLSDRLFHLSGLRVDLAQLRSQDKPFDMSTNVIQYFAPKIESERQKLPKLCRLCSRAITHDPHYIFDRNTGVCAADKINACLPLHVTTRDQLPKQICTVCFKGLNTNYEFMKKVMAAQKSLENVFSVKNKNFPTGECCPLCVVGKFSHLENRNGAVNAVEDVKMGSTQDSVPLSLHDTESPEYYLEDEVVTGYWDSGGGLHPNQGVSSVNVPSPRLHDNSFITSATGQIVVAGRKYRKRTRQDDDSEWTIDEEYLPVSRRGRPKGTRNKSKVSSGMIVEKSCALCGWLGPEVEMLNHSLSQHCQPDLGYFPCPLCKGNHSTEALLEHHLASLNCLPPV